MKKKILRLCLILFISLLPATLFTACDSDTNSYLEVLVLDELTKAPVSGVTVQVYQNNCDESDYNYRIGVTNASGIYSTYFEAPGIMSILATYNVANGGQRRGSGTVRIIEGETKNVQIILGNDIFY